MVCHSQQGGCRVAVSHTTLNNISAILCHSTLLVEKNGVVGRQITGLSYKKIIATMYSRLFKGEISDAVCGHFHNFNDLLNAFQEKNFIQVTIE